MPIELTEGFLVSKVCKPHCCPCKNAVIARRPADQSLVVFFYDNTHGPSTRCFSTGITPAALPPSVKGVALEIHIPRIHDASERLMDKSPWFNDLVCQPLPHPGAWNAASPDERRMLKLEEPKWNGTPASGNTTRFGCGK